MDPNIFNSLSNETYPIIDLDGNKYYYDGYKDYTIKGLTIDTIIDIANNINWAPSHTEIYLRPNYNVLRENETYILYPYHINQHMEELDNETFFYQDTLLYNPEYWEKLYYKYLEGCLWYAVSHSLPATDERLIK